MAKSRHERRRARSSARTWPVCAGRLDLGGVSPRISLNGQAWTSSTADITSELEEAGYDNGFYEPGVNEDAFDMCWSWTRLAGYADGSTSLDSLREILICDG
eukprot:16122758-Heterocapsa_arctica.AAC.1